MCRMAVCRHGTGTLDLAQIVTHNTRNLVCLLGGAGKPCAARAD